MTAHFAKIWEKVAELVPDQAAVVQGARRISWREYAERASRLAAAFAAAGLGPGSKVGMYLYNAPEYCETNFAALKMRAIPVNVNYRYLDDELYYLLDNADAEAVVFHASLGDRIARVAPRLDKLRLLVEVDDRDQLDVPRVHGAVEYESLLSAHEPAAPVETVGDEIYMLYTGGTTGMPKGVMYHFEEFSRFFIAGYPPMIGLPPIQDAQELISAIAARAGKAAPTVAMSGPPLMHGTGCWLGMMAPHMMGGTTVFTEGRGLDPDEIWDTVERERVQHLIVVGDAFAKPLLRALDEAPRKRDLECLKLMISSGAMFSADVKQALFGHIPGLTVADLLGSTEGGMGQSLSNKDTPPVETARFTLSETTKVFNEEGREIEPGSDEVGMVASGGLVPVGYYKDAEKSARTFREVGGVRYSFPGDMARVAADGTLELLGRGSHCINTGGEKVFPEEVEEAVKCHAAVEDTLVFGVPDDRFGSRVVAVASLSPGTQSTPVEIIAFTHERLAGYKVPRELVIVERVPRAPNGKADYAGAKAQFEAAHA